MRRPKIPGSVLFLAGLALVGALPLLARGLGRPPVDRCAADGEPLTGGHVVRAELRDFGERKFCGVVCAERWLAKRAEPPRAVFVVDEASGREVPAEDAHFVRSTITRPAGGDLVHAFETREEAERHARAFSGALLEGPRRPFGRFAAGRRAAP